jgi:Tfp pilus assembly PilM family ATPase
LAKEFHRTLGVSFSSNKIFYTELVMDTGVPVVDYVDSAEIDFNFDEDLSNYKSSQKTITNVSGDLQKYFDKRRIAYKNVSLTIGTSQSFILTLPIDLSEGKHSINSKIYWELSNYFPDNYNDFVVNTYRLSKFMPSGSTNEYLIIAVRKNVLEFVKRVFRLCNIDLTLVDIDHFAAEHSLRKSYPEEIESGNLLLIGLKKGRIDYGVISNKKYSYYTYSRYYSEPEFNLSLVRKVNSLMGERLSKLNIHDIVLYGDTLLEDTLDTLKKIPGIKAVMMNPFEGINSSSLFLKNEGLRKTAYQYAASCGVALRSLSV